jgi:hypothetical protein
MGGQQLARYGHHPDALIDFLVECEEIESIADAERLNLTGFGWEADRAKLDERIDKALRFRVGGDERAVEAKHSIRKIARGRGFILNSTAAYEGQPCPRTGAPA